MTMERGARIFVAGHHGLVGSAITRALRERGYQNLLLRTHGELDLTRQEAVREFFDRERPEYVVLAAAKVGGILANDTYPAEFIRQNLAIQANVVHESFRAGVKRLLLMASSCIYPRDCPQAIKEEYLLTGPLEKTNRAHAIAKIAGIELCGAYNEQYHTEYLCPMPTNLYGVGDNYDLASSHVLPALIRKAHEAKAAGKREMVAWGTGNPRREFLISDDLARACVALLEKDWTSLLPALPSNRQPIINVGSGADITIRDLTQLVCRVVGADCTIRWDTTKPDGTPRRLLDVSRIFSLGWRPEVPLEDGIAIAYRDFLSRQDAATATARTS
jgi:GDP-L-fucose synthase